MTASIQYRAHPQAPVMGLAQRHDTMFPLLVVTDSSAPETKYNGLLLIVGRISAWRRERVTDIGTQSRYPRCPRGTYEQDEEAFHSRRSETSRVYYI